MYACHATRPAFIHSANEAGTREGARTSVRRGPTWAVCSEGGFATHRGGDAFAARLDDQPCLGEDLDIGALIITHVSREAHGCGRIRGYHRNTGFF